MPEHTINQRYIMRFWLPLLTTWLLMASEGPVVAAMIARLEAPTLNLAAYGVALAFALVLEAPIIMMMSAAMTLVRDRDSYLRLRRYAFVLNGLVMGSALVFLATPLFDLLARQWIGLPPDIAERVHRAGWLLLPWPVAIGFRRFYQGVMISRGATRQVTVGTVVRLSSMVTTCLVLASLRRDLDGATIGAAALSTGVVAEAGMARWLARTAIKHTLAAGGDVAKLTWVRFWHFYYPLIVTSFLALAIQPLVTFFVGRARLPIESLAVLPVLTALSFIFRCFSLSMQDVIVALAGQAAPADLGLFARRVALYLAGGLALFVYTPLAMLWLTRVTGLSVSLATLSLLPLRILVLTPFCSVVLSFYTAAAIHARRTLPVTIASILEVASIAAVLWASVGPWELTGVLAATSSLAVGRFVGAAYLAGDRWRQRAIAPLRHPLAVRVATES